MDKNEELNNIDHILRICGSIIVRPPEEIVQSLLNEPHVHKFVSDSYKKGTRAEDIVKDVWNECKMHRDVVEAEIAQKKRQSQYRHGYTDVIVLKVQKSNDIRTKDGPYIFNGISFPI